MSQRLAEIEFEPTREADPLLDAARACVLAVGVRRTTFSDVARRAGVSRMTLYRRYPDREALLAALMTYEFGAVVAAARGAAQAEASCRERIVAVTVHGARALAEDPLFGRLLDLDPELLLPYVTQRLGGMQRMAIADLEAELGRPDGSVRAGDPAVLAAGIELIARGFVLAAHADRDAALDPWAELARAVDGYLRP
jgi:AcrR family transcriptional regulator